MTMRLTGPKTDQRVYCFSIQTSKTYLKSPISKDRAPKYDTFPKSFSNKLSNFNDAGKNTYVWWGYTQ